MNNIMNFTAKELEMYIDSNIYVKTKNNNSELFGKLTKIAVAGNDIESPVEIILTVDNSFITISIFDIEKITFVNKLY